MTRLHEIIGELNSVAVAYSGGTDSAYLLAACLDVLGPDRVLALTADSPLTPRGELEDARALAARLGVRHMVLPSEDLENADIVANPPDRCYHCKFSRFEALLEVAHAEGLDTWFMAKTPTMPTTTGLAAGLPKNWACGPPFVRQA